MSKRIALGLLWAFVLAGCAGGKPGRLALVGHWAPVSAELGGQTFEIANFQGAVLDLTADGYAFAGDKGTYAIVPGGPPARIDITGRSGPNAGRTIAAIYRLAGDELTICYQLGAGARPHNFVSPRGSQVLIVTYRRAP